MAAQYRSVDVAIRDFSPGMKQEVIDFVEFLKIKKKRKKSRKLRQNWAGGLKKFNTKFTSLELQKKSLNWRSE